jgi:hypothetical protein
MKDFKKENAALILETMMDNGEFFIAKNSLVAHRFLSGIKNKNWEEPHPNKPRCLEDEIPEIKWQAGDGQGNGNPEKLVDGDDHANDAVLNVIAYVDQLNYLSLERNVIKNFNTVLQRQRG